MMNLQIAPELALRRLFVQTARLFVGFREIGSNQGQIIERFQKAVDGKAEGEAYCSGAVQYWLKETTEMIEWIFNTPITFGSGIFPSESCMEVWNKSEKAYRVDYPQIGSIAIYQRYINGQPSWQGHMGVVASILNDTTIRTIEANTSAGPGLNRDGEGIYLKTRFWRHREGSFHLKGFLLPWGPLGN